MSKSDFSTLQRQSINGIFLIFFSDIVKQFKRFFYALFAPFLSESFRENYTTYLIAGIIFLVILQFVYSYLSYLKYQFQIKKNAFILQKGVIKRSTVEIPFHRIQNINLQQSIFQQLFGVVGFQIETAGEKISEIKIKALSSSTAKALKEALLEELNEEVDVNQKNEEAASFELDHNQNNPFSEKQNSSYLMKLNFLDLLKVGLSSNYLKGFGLLALFFSGVSNFVNDILSQFIPIDFDQELINRIPETLTFIALAVFLVVLLSFLITVSIQVIKYFNLKVIRIKDNFEVEYGLFKKVNQVIKKSKTQVVSFENNPILRLFGINNVFVSQAAASEITEKQKIGLVGITLHQFKAFFEAIFELPFQQKFDIFKTSYRYMVVLFWRQLIVYLAFGVAGYFIISHAVGYTLAVIAFAGFTFLNFKIVKKSYLGINDNLIRIGSGGIHTKSEFIALHKIQSLQLKRSVFQRFNGHANLVIYTASGSITVAYLPYTEAVSFVNVMLYKLESSKLSWI